MRLSPNERRRSVLGWQHLTSRGFSDGNDVNLGPSNLGHDYAASVVVSKYFAHDALGTSDLDDDFSELCSAYGVLLGVGRAAASTQPRCA